MKNINVAFVHEWLVDLGGSEKVLAAMMEYWPHAPIYTLLQDPRGSALSVSEGHPVFTSFLQRLPKASRQYRNYLPLMPIAIEQFDLSKYDLIISNSHAVAKGVLTGPDQLHLCMCYSPIRYAWDLQHQYLRESHLENSIKGILARSILHYIRLWDVRTANGVDHFIAISEFIARRIKKVYNRDSTVIYPPIDIDFFGLQEHKENFYLTASRMVTYKHIDLIVEAFSMMPDKKLVVIGNGPGFKKIQELAKSNVELMGYQSNEVLKDYMQRAKAFIFAAEEDFGIVPVEAQSCGTPVIAYGKGGLLETVIDGTTGLFFQEQSLESLRKAVDVFESRDNSFDPYLLHKSAERFSKNHFHKKFQELIENTWMNKKAKNANIFTSETK